MGQVLFRSKDMGIYTADGNTPEQVHARANDVVGINGENILARVRRKLSCGVLQRMVIITDGPGINDDYEQLSPPVGLELARFLLSEADFNQIEG